MTKVEKKFIQHSKEKKFIQTALELMSSESDHTCEQITETLWGYAMTIRLLIPYEDIDKYVKAINVKSCNLDYCTNQYLRVINQIETA